MNLDELTVGQVKEIQALLNNQSQATIGEEIINRKCIVRTYSAGVFFGIVRKRSGKEMYMTDVRQLWRWAGAATLCQLAMTGTSKPDECKFPCVVDELLLTEVIEIIPCSAAGITSIEGVDVWQE